MRKLLCVGDLNIDYVCKIAEYPSSGGETSIVETSARMGGSASTIAAFACRFGLQSHLASTIGDDWAGKIALKEVKNHGVHSQLVNVKRNAPTGVSFIFIDRKGDRTMFTSRGANVNVDSPKLRQIHSRDYDAIFLSGYMFLGEAANHSNLSSLVRGTTGVKVYLDVRGIEAEKNLYGIVAMLKSVDVAFLRDDAFPLIAHEGIMRELAAADSGRLIVQYSSANEGCSLYAGGRIVTCRPYESAIVSFLGANDAFIAGFIACHIKGWDAKKSADFANALKAKVISGVPLSKINEAQIRSTMRTRKTGTQIEYLHANQANKSVD